MKRAQGRDFSRVQGSVLIEFALVFPIIVVLMMGMLELSRFCYEYKVLQNQAHNTARILTTYVPDLLPPSDVQSLFVTGRPGCTECKPILPGLAPGNVDMTTETRSWTMPGTTQVEKVNALNVSYKGWEYTPTFSMFASFFTGKRFTVNAYVRQIY